MKRLVECRVGSHGAAALEAALPSNASLQRIDMTSCGLSPADSKAVITALLGAKGLQIAKIDLNNFGIDGAERLASSLQSKGIRYCMTEENGGSLGKGAFEQMVASFDEASPSGKQTRPVCPVPQDVVGHFGTGAASFF